jgi:hypothetical protein
MRERGWKGLHLQARSKAQAALDEAAGSAACRSGCRRSTIIDAAAAGGDGSIHWGQSPELPASTRWSYTHATPVSATATGMMQAAAQEDASRLKREEMAGRLGARAAAVEVQRASATRAVRRGHCTATRRPQAEGPRRGERRAKACEMCSQPGETDSRVAHTSTPAAHTSSHASLHACAHSDTNDSSSLSSPAEVNSGRRSQSTSMLPERASHAALRWCWVRAYQYTQWRRSAAAWRRLTHWQSSRGG